MGHDIKKTKKYLIIDEWLNKQKWNTAQFSHKQKGLSQQSNILFELGFSVLAGF